MSGLRIFLLSMVFSCCLQASQAAVYTNPIISADYSDPDVIRVGEDYWMVASSFNCMPGIPILHSRDLVNWELAGHVYSSLPLEKYDKPAHGEGSWAPSIRFHDGLFYVYFCTPEDGLFVARAADPRSEWDLKQVVDVVKWEDPCPLWDVDGNAYLAHSIHRGGPLVVHRMSPDGLELLDDGVVVYHDEEANPILEGIKIDRYGDWYVVMAPAGGVEQGWQTALRSKNIYGPYEAKRVLEQGPTDINGPHQGGLVETPDGDWWFVHFQSKGTLGRILHLQPASWGPDDWPRIGVDLEGNGIGNPVAGGDTRLPECKPDIPASDDFSAVHPGLQWQWQANPRDEWYSLSDSPGRLRLNAVSCPSEHGNLWYAPNLLLQKFPAEKFSATVEIEPCLSSEGERAGLIIMGKEYSYIGVVRDSGGKDAIAVVGGKYDKFATRPQTLAQAEWSGAPLTLRVDVEGEACRYSYSTDDGKNFLPLGPECHVEPGMWIGAKAGLFCASSSLIAAKGWTYFDNFQVEVPSR